MSSGRDNDELLLRASPSQNDIEKTCCTQAMYRDIGVEVSLSISLAILTRMKLAY
jgi:hypothetical protein